MAMWLVVGGVGTVVGLHALGLARSIARLNCATVVDAIHVVADVAVA